MPSIFIIIIIIITDHHHHHHHHNYFLSSETFRFNHLISTLLPFAVHFEASSCGITNTHLQQCLDDFKHDQHNYHHQHDSSSSSSSSSSQLSGIPTVKLPMISLNMSYNHFLSYVDCPWTNARSDDDDDDDDDDIQSLM